MADPAPHDVTPPDLAGFTHMYSGKVRDLYAVDADPRLVLVVASDRISAYDHVLPTPIPGKGVVLTQMSAWWFAQIADIVATHMVSVDDGIPTQVQGRAMLCRRLEMAPVECVARGYLAGSGWADYQRSGEVCGIALPPGLTDGDRLPAPIFTPATKAELGAHDENVAFDDVVALVGDQRARRLRDLTLAVYSRAEQVARDSGVLLADTKLEFGIDPTDPGSGDMLGDEILTPDSSRFWPAEGWRPGSAQPSFDKQYVRDWLTSPESGWARSSGEPPPALPDDVVERTQQRYLEAYQRLTGRSLEV